MPNLLVVWHSQSGGTARLAEAVLEGARTPEIEGVAVRTVDSLVATADDVRWANAILLGTSANFGYMSGALKHFFDSVFYEVLDDTPGLPFAAFVKGSTDAEGALRAIVKITTGLGWKEVRAPLVVIGDLTDEHLEQAWELGASFAAGLAESIL